MIDIKYRTGTRRFFASIIDGLVFIPFMFLDSYVRSIHNNGLLIISTLIITIASIAYSVLLHAKYGQTLGKMVVHIKVVDISEVKPISFPQAFIRDSLWIIMDLAGIIYYSIQVIRTNGNPSIWEDYDAYINTVTSGWGILELVSMLSNAKRRAIHDYLAKTVVIRTR